MNNDITYKCPLCQGIMVSQIGSILHPGDPKFGMSLRCPHYTCPAQEVAGHGKSEKDAYEAITDKFIKR